MTASVRLREDIGKDWLEIGRQGEGGRPVYNRTEAPRRVVHAEGGIKMRYNLMGSCPLKQGSP